MSQLDLSDRLFELVFDAVREAMIPLREGETLVPFALVLTKGGVEMRRFTDENIGAALERARKTFTAADEDMLAYALAYDATITVEETDFDAVLVEAGERGKANGWRFAQRYLPRTLTSLHSPIRELAYLGKTELYF
ncbi:MAG: hypothetical protein KC496_19855 [Anaerolineae bacterium]|nr:hypothetical protein [Anaerolineae bacterium]